MSFNGVDLIYSNDIHLPSNGDFKNLKSAKKLAIDIGGSLVKIVYLSEVKNKRKRLNSFSSSDLHNENETDSQKTQSLYTVEEKDHLEERLYFKKFETKYVDDGLKFIKENILSYGSDKSNKVLHATGGGAIKYKDLIESTLDVKVEKEDEIECLINGCNFLLTHLPNESFTFRMKDEDEVPELKFQNLSKKEFFPYLLVNIGSGVSIIKVEGIDTYERIGGTSTGGGTFWGLGSLLTNAKGFDELLDMAIHGKTKNVDMLVKDIYGGGYDLMKLPAELVASSFGKACRASGEHRDSNENKFRPQDIAKALLRMISNDIGQISSLYAQVHGLTRIIFAGYFIRGHPVTMQTMSYAVNFFSKGSQQALFMRHEGYLGAIGAFLASAASISGSVHWNENYAALIAAENIKKEEKFHKLYDYDTFELDRIEKTFDLCPLLLVTDSTYSDFINLGTNQEARDYWLDKLEYEIDSFTEAAVATQPERNDARIRGDNMKECFLRRLTQLRKFPYALGKLTIHSLIEMRKQFLNLFDFNDIYMKTRQTETDDTLSLLESHLKSIDEDILSDKEEELFINLLAANTVDCQISNEFKGNLSSCFVEAKSKMQIRPWLIDDVDKWKTLRAQYQLIVIFVDKSGVDIVLGIFPLVRHFIAFGSKVILAANTGYAKNDILYQELIVLAERIGEMCPVINDALNSRDLRIMESGSCSQCLDLRTVESELVKSMKNADLIILEGIERCIYTNFHEEFSCDSIRCCVLTDAWAAEKVGGKINDVFFKFDKGK